MALMMCFLVIEMALNSQALAHFAAEEGMDFVKSLWTEKGVTNPKALFTNTLVGMMWIIFAMIVVWILPPFRTIRSGIVKGLFPASLKAVSESIDLNADDLKLRLRSNEPNEEDSGQGSKDEGTAGEDEATNGQKSNDKPLKPGTPKSAVISW